MDEPSQPQDVQELPTSLKWLRNLVFVLTVVMIGGLITLVTVFVTRFPKTNEITLPDTITLPEGTSAVAFTQGEGWYAVVTSANEIMIFDRLSGALRQTVTIDAQN